MTKVRKGPNRASIGVAQDVLVRVKHFRRVGRYARGHSLSRRRKTEENSRASRHADMPK
jgi:hypothetical protein